MAELTWTELDQRAVDTGRVLAADAVQKVGNGHPGTAISLSPLAYTLFQKVMRHDPSDDQWIGRDRFVLSIGHSSLTLYNQLYFAGYGLEKEDTRILAYVGFPYPGPSRVQAHQGRRDDNRPAGSGHLRRCWYGHGQPPRTWPLRSRGTRR